MIIDLSTNKEVDKMDEIEKVSLEYCKELLTNPSPRVGFGGSIQQKMNINELRMAEVNSEYEFELEKTMFHNAIERIKRKNPTKYPLHTKIRNFLHQSTLLPLQTCLENRRHSKSKEED